ncbi:MAG: carbohydrate ABC transporter permease [Fimbriimonadaceae bacterium]
MIAPGRRWTSYLFLLPFTLSFCTFVVTPIIVAALLACSNLDLTSRQSARWVGVTNFRDALKDDYFHKAAIATCTYAGMMIPALISLGFAFALGLQAMKKGRNFARGLLFVPGMFNVVVAALIWRWFYEGEFGFFNYLLKKVGLGPVHWLTEQSVAMRSVVGMSLWWSLGGTTVILLAALQQIPSHLYEAAMLDGATGPRVFARITLPQLRPVLLFLLVTSTIAAYQVFGQPQLLTGGGPELSTRGVVQLIYETAFNQYRLGYAAAISWLLFAMIGVPVLLIVFLLRRAVD